MRRQGRWLQWDPQPAKSLSGQRDVEGRSEGVEGRGCRAGGRGKVRSLIWLLLITLTLTPGWRFELLFLPRVSHLGFGLPWRQTLGGRLGRKGNPFPGWVN